ncbi:MAG: FlgD immunoglobulin-like domain containing protein [bacterium]
MRPRRSRIALVALPLVAPILAAATWHVTPDGSGDAPTIAAALTMAAAGDSVLLACGTYHEHEVMVRKTVTLASETGLPDCVTIDAGRSGGVLHVEGLAAPTVIGLTITGGRASFGGGIWAGSGAAPSFRECVFADNAAAEGGGAYCFHTTPRFTHCEFRGNSADYWGGGLSCFDNTSPLITDCTFTGNCAGIAGGAVWSYFSSTPRLTTSTLAGNTAGSSGGALHALGAGFVCDRTLVWGNCALEGRTLVLAGVGAAASFSCCDVDTGLGWRDGAGAVTWPGPNVSADPLFCAPLACEAAPSLGGDFSLRASSPCLPGGNPCAAALGAPGAACLATASPEPAPRLSTLAIRAFPNPFRERATISFVTPSTALVDISIYRADGRLVRALARDIACAAGAHDVEWDGRDSRARRAAAGIYFVRVSAGRRHLTERLVRVP